MSAKDSLEYLEALMSVINNGTDPDKNDHLATSQIHLGNLNYTLFCKYAGIKVLERTKSSILVEYDNPYVKGKVRWSDSLYGEIAGTFSSGTTPLHWLIMEGLEFPAKYRTKCSIDSWCITRHGFEEYLNDLILEGSKESEK